MLRTKTLVQRIAVAILLPLLVASAIIGSLLIRRHAQDMQTQRLESARATIGQFAALAELPLATGSRGTMREIADFMQRTAKPLGIALLDKHGNVLESRGDVGAFALNTAQGKPLSAQIEVQQHTLSLLQPVFLATNPSAGFDAKAQTTTSLVGYAALVLSSRGENEALRNLWYTGIAILLAASLLSFLFAYRVLRGIVKPLDRLNAAFDRMRAGDLDARVAYDGVDDLQRLAASFNAMGAQLKSARQNLRGEIDAATLALAKRTEEAEAANRAKSRFLAAASHDLRQPAHALALYMAAFRQTLKQQPQSVRETLFPALDGMHAASRSLDALLGALLDMSRFDAGVVEVKKTAVALDEVVNEAITVLASSAAERGLRLRARVPQIEIETDATLVRRIIDNLVSNAIRFTRSGRILVTVRQRRTHVLLQVWDQGVGIAANDLAMIFEEFFQVKRSQATQGGMGLGLAIVARSTALLGGRVDVRSVVGRGSCFSVTLPGVAMRRLRFPELPTDLAKTSQHRVLILDDDPLVRDSMRALFGSLDFKPIAASTLVDLLSAIGRDDVPIAAAVIDYRLQNGFTGIEAARSIRQRVGDTVPIALITGDTSPERLQLLQQSGFPVQHKPLNADRLLSALNINAQLNGR
jgi:two-component system, sensor histidine kinase